MKATMLNHSALAFTMLAALFLFFANHIQAAPKASITSNGTGGGSWNSTATWAGGVVPGVGDDVTIANGDIVTYNLTTTVASLVVNGNLRMNSVANTSRTLTVTGGITVNSGGVVTPTNQTGTNTHSLVIGGNFSNDGILNSNSGGAAADTINFIFNGTSNQTVSGAGTNSFNNITVNNSGGASNNIVEVTASNFSAPSAFLVLTAGIFKLSTNSTITLSNSTYTINTGAGLIINHASAVVNIGTTLTVNGTLQLLNGTFNTGSGNNAFTINNLASATFSGGILNHNGSFQINSGGTVTITGTAINIDPQVGATTLSGANDIFSAVGGANLTFTSGAVTIIDPHLASGSGNAVQLVSGAGTKNLTGSTFQLGNGVSSTSGSADGFDVNCGSGITLGNLIVNNPSGANRHVRLVTNNCILGSTLTIAAGEFQLNGQNITIAGNFSNNGTFTPNANTVTFNGNSTQAISGTSGTTFANLTISNTNGVDLNTNGTVTGTLTLTTDLTATNGITLLLNLGANSSGAGDVWGNTARNHTFSLGTMYSFGNPNISLNFANGTPPTQITVYLTRSVSAASGFTNAVQRMYAITPVGASSYNATLRLAYRDSELNGNTEAGLDLWRFGGPWMRVTKTGSNPTANWIEASGVTQFSPWALSENGPLSPTAVRLTGLSAQTTDESARDVWNWVAGIGSVAVLSLAGASIAIRSAHRAKRNIT